MFVLENPFHGALYTLFLSWSQGHIKLECSEWLCTKLAISTTNPKHLLSPSVSLFSLPTDSIIWMNQWITLVMYAFFFILKCLKSTNIHLGQLFSVLFYFFVIHWLIFSTKTTWQRPLFFQIQLNFCKKEF